MQVVPFPCLDLVYHSLRLLCIDHAGAPFTCLLALITSFPLTRGGCAHQHEHQKTTVWTFPWFDKWTVMLWACGPVAVGVERHWVLAPHSFPSSCKPGTTHSSYTLTTTVAWPTGLRHEGMHHLTRKPYSNTTRLDCPQQNVVRILLMLQNNSAAKTLTLIHPEDPALTEHDRSLSAQTHSSNSQQRQ